MKRYDHPLRYPGARSRCGELLAALAPVGYRQYRECFAGSASMLSFVRSGVPAWINDINPGIVRWHQWMKDDPEAINQIMHCKAALKTEAQKRDAFEAAKVQYRATRDPLAYTILNRFAVNGIVSLTRSNVASFCSQFSRCGLTSITRERLEYCRSVLRSHDTKITRADYSVILDTPGTNVFLFVDPPFLVKSGFASSMYESMLSRDQHVVLRDRLRDCPHKWLLTLGDCRFSVDLYKEFRMLRRRYRHSNYAVNCSRNGRSLQRWKCELMVFNY